MLLNPYLIWTGNRLGLGMVTTGGGLTIAGNIAAAMAIRKLDIDVPRYGWWLVGGSLLVPTLILAAPQLLWPVLSSDWGFQ